MSHCTWGRSEWRLPWKMADHVTRCFQDTFTIRNYPVWRPVAVRLVCSYTVGEPPSVVNIVLLHLGTRADRILFGNLPPCSVIETDPWLARRCRFVLDNLQRGLDSDSLTSVVAEDKPTQILGDVIPVRSRSPDCEVCLFSHSVFVASGWGCAWCL